MMADPIRQTATPVSSRVFPAILLFLGLGASALEAQVPQAGAYPVDPAAAAGMTSGLPNGVTFRQAEMMQVRTSAQGAQGEAAAASMARSADLSIEERNREAALQTARTNKAIKEEMRNRQKYQVAAEQYNKVSSNEMSTWRQNGGVRVERNVPDAFLMSLIEEEEQAAARAAASGEKKGFSLFGGGGNRGEDDGVSFLSSIKPPRLPFTGGRDSGQSSAAPAPVNDTSEPVFAGGSSASSQAAPAQAAPKPGVVPMISGAALVDGRSPASPTATPSPADQTPQPQQRVSFSDHMPDSDKKKPGLFSRLSAAEDEDTSLVPTSRDSGGGGGFLGFGKKKSPAPTGGIDASLFPEGSVDRAPTGGRLSGGATVESVSQEFASVPATGSDLVLPGQTVEKPRGGGFSLPKPNLSIPSVAKPSGGGAALPVGAYVINGNAQFMVYGADQMQSEIRALPAGTPVTVTKPGEQWAGIRLSDGTEGVVQNKFLKP